jgi:hypothetical protein
LGLCDWGKEMAGTSGRSIFASIFRSHVISRDASEVATYSISHVDSAIIGCLLDSQAISAPAPRNRYPLINLQVDVSPA